MIDKEKIREKAVVDIENLLEETNTPFEECTPIFREAMVACWVRGYEKCDAEWHKTIDDANMVIV